MTEQCVKSWFFANTMSKCGSANTSDPLTRGWGFKPAKLVGQKSQCAGVLDATLAKGQRRARRCANADAARRAYIIGTRNTAPAMSMADTVGGANAVVVRHALV